MCNKIIDFQNTGVFKKRQENRIEIPVYEYRIPAGTPSNIADDRIENVISLDTVKMDSLKGKKPEHLAVFTICGRSMEPLLQDNQKVIIDNQMPNYLSLKEMTGRIVIARVHNELTIKKFDADKKYFYLIPLNPEFPVIKVKRDSEDFRIVAVLVDILEPGI